RAYRSRMAEEWFVRVLGREYGPVDLETLREWKADGRLIATNEVRGASDAAWVQAGSIAELFPPSTPPPLAYPASQPAERRRGFMEIIVETCRLYAKGFLTFAGLAALVGIPELGFRLSVAFTNLGSDAPPGGRIAAGLAVVMAAAFVVMWPLFVGGLQFATAELAEGRRVRLRDTLRRAINFWPRIAQLSVITYSAFFFWIGMPLLVSLGAVAQPSAISLLLALLSLCAGVYMFARLFVNFLFWQQTATIGGLHGLEALQESKEVARSARSAPWLERPLSRGAMLASLWVVFDLIVGAAVQLPFLLARLMPAQNFDEAIAIVQALLRGAQPDASMIATYVVAIGVDTLLRPSLGIAFVVLYFDARTRL
ncbi:MAG TPA: DUF4339 domain-containing protein, partial [Chthoniobacterales bacterium]|nr:DUF4339 domain-containing protein [Chthoniobacterales bacterium]